MSDFHVIMTADYVHELGVVRSLLESNGIPTFVNNEFSSQLVPYRSLGNSVKLLVRNEDASKAVSILEDNNFFEINDNLYVNTDDKDYVDSIFTEWTIFGNYKPVKNKLLFVLVIVFLIAIVIVAILGH